MTPALVVMGGLPGVGKTSIARALAARTAAVHLRIDTIEAALLRRGVSFEGPAGDTGYVVAYAQARELLLQGRSVIVDGVHGWSDAATLWDEARAPGRAKLVRVQLTCTDPEVHRARVETRESDLPGLSLPSWSQVLNRQAKPFENPELSFDTATFSAEEIALQIRAFMTAS